MNNKLNFSTTILLVFLFLYFFLFLIYPLFYVVNKSIIVEGKLSLDYFKLIITNPIQLQIFLNSLKIAIITTIFTSILSIPLSFLMTYNKFPLKNIIYTLLLIPLIIPPFVGAIGIKQIFGRYGTINLLLENIGIVGIDWLGKYSFFLLIFLEVMHLFPIMMLNCISSLSNINPSLEDSAYSLGGSAFRVITKIILPLMMPGYFAGAAIVFIWSFTDLGTPLILNFHKVLPVQIFNLSNDIYSNPMGYAVVVVVMIISLSIFVIAKSTVFRKKYEISTQGYQRNLKIIKPFSYPLIYLFFAVVIFLSALPHISVFLTSISAKWFLTPFPQKFTFKYYNEVFNHKLSFLSIKNSLILSTISCLLNIFIGIIISYLIVRKKILGKEILDVLVMMPLAIPGVVLAFGYLSTFSNTILNPKENPFILLTISYSIRRIPYTVRSIMSGFQQADITLEEASINLGASRFQSIRKITLPIISSNIFAGAILSFSFAMLEVSDSMILAMKEQFYPITKAIYSLLGRISDGQYIASSMGVLGMILLFSAIFLASQLLGKKMGDIFKM